MPRRPGLPHSLGVPPHAQAACLESVEAAPDGFPERRLVDGLQVGVLTVVEVKVVHSAPRHADALTQRIVLE